MTPRSWMRQLFARTPGNVRKAPARFRPQLESLESRYVLSTLVVTNNSDTGISGDGSLRGELAAAASGDTIAFAGSLKGKTNTLTQGELALSQSLTIAGPVANPVTINGNDASRVFDITSSSAIVTLSGLTITLGGAFKGGGIDNTGTLTVSQCSLSGNSAGSSGGIWNDFGATLNVLNHSSITGNTPDDVQNLGRLNQDKSSTIGVLD